MSWKRYDGSFPGYGYQDYGTSQFGGNILWAELLLSTTQWNIGVSSDGNVWTALSRFDPRWDIDAPYEVDLSDGEVYLSDEHIYLLCSGVWKVNWNREW